jgi:hypothetical protein
MRKLIKVGLKVSRAQIKTVKFQQKIFTFNKRLQNNVRPLIITIINIHT